MKTESFCGFTPVSDCGRDAVKMARETQQYRVKRLGELFAMDNRTIEKLYPALGDIINHIGLYSVWAFDKGDCLWHIAGNRLSLSEAYRVPVIDAVLILPVGKCPADVFEILGI